MLQNKRLDLISFSAQHRRFAFLQFSFAHRAELFLFPIQFIKGMWVEHDTFVIAAMRKPVNMPQLMRAFLCEAFNKVFIVRRAIIKVIVEPDTGNDRNPCLWPCKPENKIEPCCKEVLADHEEHRSCNVLPVFHGPQAVEYHPCIDLPPLPDITVKDQGTITNLYRCSGNCCDGTGRPVRPGLPVPCDPKKYGRPFPILYWNGRV